MNIDQTTITKLHCKQNNNNNNSTINSRSFQSENKWSIRGVTDFSILKKWLKFCVKNEIKCAKTLEMLTIGSAI